MHHLAKGDEVMEYIPCKGCKDRRAEPNCHTDCERYLSYINELHAKRDKVWEGKMKDMVWLSSSIKQRTKQRKERENAERYR